MSGGSFSCLFPAERDVLGLVICLMRTRDLMYMGGSVCQDSCRRCDSGLVDVTLTENRDNRVGVSGKPDTRKLLLLPLAPLLSLF